MSETGLGVVIATFERAALARRAVESVLAQGSEEVELVVVDDGSSDGTAESLADLAVVRLVRQEHLGVNAARNRGLAESTRRWVVTFDDDDVLEPGALAAVREAIGSFPDADRYPVLLFGSSNSRQERAFELVGVDHYLSRRVGGDLIPVIQRERFLAEGLRYPETPVGGEHLLWLAVAQSHGIPAWSTVIVRKSVDDVRRLSSARTQIARARDHALLQEETLVRFGELFRSSYPAEYARRRVGAATYWLLAGERRRAREQLRRSSLPRASLLRAGLWLLAFAPTRLVRAAFLRFRELRHGL